MIEKHASKPPSHVTKFWIIRRKFLHLLFNAILEMPFLKMVVSMLGFFRKTFHSFLSIPLFLYHFSPIWGNRVASTTKDYASVNFMSPILTSTPSKALVKNLVTSFWNPSNFTTNSIHCAFCNNSLVWGYPSKNFLPIGSFLTITPMVEKLRLKSWHQSSLVWQCEIAILDICLCL